MAGIKAGRMDEGYNVDGSRDFPPPGVRPKVASENPSALVTARNSLKRAPHAGASFLPRSAGGKESPDASVSSALPQEP
ncbi:hypothetical protein PUN4_520190 [Paraburkholderia unamae]|nr:hypothetical protein PUN4_520190 [Paraburkholderia unamae]